MKAKKGIVVFILAAALLVSMAGVVSASQTWEFDHDNVMYKRDPPHTETGLVTINTSDSNVWRAEYAANGSVFIPDCMWIGHLKCTVPSQNKKFTVEIGIWNGSSFTSKAKSSKITFDVFDKSYIFYDPDGFTVPTNQWLAARVNNNGTENFTLITDSSCYIKYSCQTFYPNPPLLPDLNITNKSETFLDSNFTVNYTVMNIGAKGAGASNTTIYINGINVSEDPVLALAVGENYTNNMVGPFKCPCGQTLNVTVCADNGDVVVESDETNNCRVNKLECPPCPTSVPEYSMTGLLALIVIMSIVLASVVLKVKKRNKK